MKADDQARLESGEFSHEDWNALWDRIPEKMRKGTVEFVLHKLHAIESSGRYQIRWEYVTSTEREETGAPIFDHDQPGDVITFGGLVQFGYR
ncbi:MAG: hypothetical protein JWM11_1836 [Planctomycetaceae bacterium]|nr:hypothetical protein [Planctomycetaceae bacterium]